MATLAVMVSVSSARLPGCYGPVGRLHMVGSVGHEERERAEALHDGSAGLRTMEPLEQLL
jgi:hypothetical protein